MNLNHKFSIFTFLATALTLSSGMALAADAPMICAATHAISCEKEAECVSGGANDVNMPLFLKINPEKKEILSLREGGERRTSIIRQTTRDKDERFVVYQGVDAGGAWSTVINEKTGAMTISIAAGDKDAYIIYGACSASLLKP